MNFRFFTADGGWGLGAQSSCRLSAVGSYETAPNRYRARKFHLCLSPVRDREGSSSPGVMSDQPGPESPHRRATPPAASPLANAFTPACGRQAASRLSHLPAAGREPLLVLRVRLHLQIPLDAGSRITVHVGRPPVRRRVPQLAVTENPLDTKALAPLDERDDAHRPPTLRTLQRVDLEDPLDERCPPAPGLEAARRLVWGPGLEKHAANYTTRVATFHTRVATLHTRVATLHAEPAVAPGAHVPHDILVDPSGIQPGFLATSSRESFVRRTGACCNVTIDAQFGASIVIASAGSFADKEVEAGDVFVHRRCSPTPPADCGKRRAASGLRRAECGERNAESEMRKAESGKRRAASGERQAESGKRRAECGMRNAECGMRNAECGSRRPVPNTPTCGEGQFYGEQVADDFGPLEPKSSACRSPLAAVRLPQSANAERNNPTPRHAPPSPYRAPARRRATRHLCILAQASPSASG